MNEIFQTRSSMASKVMTPLQTQSPNTWPNRMFSINNRLVNCSWFQLGLEDLTRGYTGVFLSTEGTQVAPIWWRTMENSRMCWSGEPGTHSKRKWLSGKEETLRCCCRGDHSTTMARKSEIVSPSTIPPGLIMHFAYIRFAMHSRPSFIQTFAGNLQVWSRQRNKSLKYGMV